MGWNNDFFLNIWKKQIFEKITQHAKSWYRFYCTVNFQAIDYYSTALSLSEQGYKEARQSIVWELSTTYFNMASLLQDYAPLSLVKKEEVRNYIQSPTEPYRFNS